MKAKIAKSKHRVVVEMDDAFMRMFVRLAKAMRATTYAGAVRQLIVAESERRMK